MSSNYRGGVGDNLDCGPIHGVLETARVELDGDALSDEAYRARVLEEWKRSSYDRVVIDGREWPGVRAVELEPIMPASSWDELGFADGEVVEV